MNSIILNKENDNFIIKSNSLTKSLVFKTKNNIFTINKINNKYEISANTLDDLCSKYENHIDIFYNDRPLDLTKYIVSIDGSLTLSSETNTYYLYSTRKNILKINVNEAPAPISNIIDSNIYDYLIEDNILSFNLLFTTKILTPETLDFIALNRTSDNTFEIKDIKTNIISTYGGIHNCGAKISVAFKDLLSTIEDVEDYEFINDIIDFYFTLNYKEQTTNHKLIRIGNNSNIDNKTLYYKYNEDYNINFETYLTINNNFSLRYSFLQVKVQDEILKEDIKHKKTKILVTDNLYNLIGNGFELFKKIYNNNPQLEMYYLLSDKSREDTSEFSDRIIYYRSVEHFNIFNESFIFLYSDNILNLLPINNGYYREVIDSQKNIKLKYEIVNPEDRKDKDNSKLKPTLNNQLKIIESYFNYNKDYKAILHSTYIHRKLKPTINKYKRWRRNNTWRNYKYIFSKFPIIQNKIIFESFYGNSLAGNPMEILKCMLENIDYANMKFVVVENKNNRPFKNVIYVPKYSAKYLYHIATAKYVISNVRLGKRINFRDNQYYIQTWHGTPIKRLVHDMKSFKIGRGDKEQYLNNFDLDVSKWSLLFIPNSYSDNILKSAFHYNGPTILGYPRNYSLTLDYEKEYINSLKQSLSINTNDKVYLYTPTFREDNTQKTSVYIHSLKMDLERLSKIKNKTFLIRTHYLISNSLDIEGYDNIIDVSNYPEINDLFLVSDVLINDYSSTMFDYHYLRRPVILYAYDLNHYMNKLRGFYMDYYSLSDNICYSEEELYRVINDDSEKLLNLSDDFTPEIDMDSIIDDILNIENIYTK